MPPLRPPINYEDVLFAPWAMYTGGRSITELDDNPAAAAILAPSVIPGLRGLGRLSSFSGDFVEQLGKHTAMESPARLVGDVGKTIGGGIESVYDRIGAAVNSVKDKGTRDFAEGLIGISRKGFLAPGLWNRLAGFGTSAALTAIPLALMQEQTHMRSALDDAEVLKQTLEQLSQSVRRDQ